LYKLINLDVFCINDTYFLPIDNEIFKYQTSHLSSSNRILFIWYFSSKWRQKF